MNPELKRIVGNLSCQEHKFMYCPCCKNYEEIDFDPVENIKKFMQYVKEEKEKIEKRKRKRRINVANRRKNKDERKLPDDSVSEITDLDKDEILHKYLEENMTKAERKRKERAETRKRLYGETKASEERHLCTTTHTKNGRPKSMKDRQPKVRMELRQVKDGVSMMDESNSAH
mmetsp:Transcript_1923/g.2743  ORF Transcript_1923/g.2743 Transcript_1923/m.2743 type:complete len:173 (-) Transcript_1923:1853-2371(-)